MNCGARLVAGDPDAAERLIEGARERLEIANPYVGDRGMVDRIAAAAERGVAVPVVIRGGRARQHGRLRRLPVPPRPSAGGWGSPCRACPPWCALKAGRRRRGAGRHAEPGRLGALPQPGDRPASGRGRGWCSGATLFEVDIGASQAGAAAVGRRARLRNAALERMAPLLWAPWVRQVVAQRRMVRHFLAGAG